MIRVVAFICALLSTCPAFSQVLFSTNASPSPPAAAVTAGYNTLTFSSTFAPSVVDSKNTLAPGFQWYIGNAAGALGGDCTLSIPNPISFNADGTATINGNIANAFQITSATAVPPCIAATWVGTAFGGGGYFEAVIKYTAPTNVVTVPPSWFGVPIEAAAALPSFQWTGQAAGYDHYVEVDFLEGNPPTWYFSMHDWYGIVSVTCPSFYCDVNSMNQEPAGINFAFWHRVGFLWVPATGTSSGTGTMYIDGVQRGPTLTWTECPSNQSPPPAAPYLFCLLDQQHLVLVLGGGQGLPLTVYSVRVWQASAAGNLVQ